MTKIYQAFNPRSKSWVKYCFTKQGSWRPLDVKQIKPTIPFKGVPKRGMKR